MGQNIVRAPGGKASHQRFSFSFSYVVPQCWVGYEIVEVSDIFTLGGFSVIADKSMDKSSIHWKLVSFGSSVTEAKNEGVK
ncbi:hypothetical protein RRG08_022517 [Elysia crispata]|uniref:Uncharacterized protein n=1 Tax=Elysia crispata TaxID=231223 RepID=A0AAE1D991_9GAST|nr:hypothetical protein RRG08_022517 [Elysia crispata]